VEGLSGWVRGELEDARGVLDALMADGSNAERVAGLCRRIAESVEAGGKVLACGNGGSAADAMHFCEELTGKYRDDRPAIAAAACVDPTHLTCVANDYGFEFVFSRWVEALGRAGDVLVVLSTSGNSANCVRAVEAGKSRGLVTAALLGGDGGELRGACDFEWVVPSVVGARVVRSDRIQELHMLLLHAVVGGVERALGYAG